MGRFFRVGKIKFKTIGLMIFAAILFVCSLTEVFAVTKDCSAEGAFKIIKNREEQYSIMQCSREPALGWKEVPVKTKECGQKKCGTKQECMDRIQELWLDIRPPWLK